MTESARLDVLIAREAVASANRSLAPGTDEQAATAAILDHIDKLLDASPIVRSVRKTEAPVGTRCTRCRNRVARRELVSVVIANHPPRLVCDGCSMDLQLELVSAPSIR